MKRTPQFFLFAASLLLLGGTTAVAQPAGEPTPRIQVTGTSTITLAPDELTMSISILHDNPSAQATVAAYKAAREDVIATLRKFNVGDSNITEQGLSFAKQIERDYKTGKVTREYYRATTTINIVLRKFDSYPDLVIALTNLPGVELGYVNYRSSKEIETRHKARMQAMEAAKKKATDMAAVCGAKLGRPLLINENNPGSPYLPVQSNTVQYGYGDGGEFREASTALIVSNDAIQVTASVYVEFALE